MSAAMEYAQARIQARHGARPSGAAWSALHAAVAMPALLEAARATPLKPWTAGLESVSPRELDRILRERLRAHIDEVARWMPAAWRPAVLWTAVLLEPAGFAHTAEARREWLDEFRRRWPAGDGDARAAMEELVALVERHVASFARTPLDDAWPRRLALQAHLQSLFRRHALVPAAAFAHLALVALDLERLRAELWRMVPP
jgi:hypothetical protein